MDEQEIIHRPVLLETLEGLLDFGGGAVIVDATVGQGGHAATFAGRLGKSGCLVGLDVDLDNIAVATGRLSKMKCRTELVHENFSKLDVVLGELGLEKVDLILADLGVNSAQLARSERGFSFQEDGPLDMRMDDRLEQSAAELVNRLGEKELADLIFKYGEERRSRRIARSIVWHRSKEPIDSTFKLVRAIESAVGPRRKGPSGRIHPATRTFQALRIAVNDEMGALEKLLEMAPGLLREGGQFAVISFHSLEDRQVKLNFRENAKNGIYELQTRKPLQADQEERDQNPRSRSAKLRLAKRI